MVMLSLSIGWGGREAGNWSSSKGKKKEKGERLNRYGLDEKEGRWAEGERPGEGEGGLGWVGGGRGKGRELGQKRERGLVRRVRLDRFC
jgi:hypothetical protein